DHGFVVLGRESELIKILGETVNLSLLSHRLEEFISSPFCLLPKTHDRNGYELILVVEGEGSAINLDKINGELMPYERISRIEKLTKIPRSPLGKVQKHLVKKAFNQ
ncbi:MAG: hypothetical protein AAF203_10985, partial [Pseudomonadota bacterium]